MTTNQYQDHMGQRVIGRMTSEAGQRVVIIEQWCDDMTHHIVFVNDSAVFAEDDRVGAIRVARWWMAGCPA